MPTDAWVAEKLVTIRPAAWELPQKLGLEREEAESGGHDQAAQSVPGLRLRLGARSVPTSAKHAGPRPDQPPGKHRASKQLRPGSSQSPFAHAIVPWHHNFLAPQLSGQILKFLR